MSGQVELDDGTPVTLRRSARARRLTLRVSSRDGSVTLTLPPSLRESAALEFLDSRREWLRKALSSAHTPKLVGFGDLLPVEGDELELVAASVRRPIVDGNRLLLPQGRSAAASAAGFLRTFAQARLTEASDHYAAALGLQFTAIALRDTTSRWGSCTHDGRLMYSWRLAMAPPEVLRYVAAHEVAHLAHMDHSPRYWAVVRSVCADYADHRAWLRQHGSALHRWKFRES